MFAESLNRRALLGHHVTDQGSLLTSKFWSSLCYLLGIKRRLSTAFHQQTDCQTDQVLRQNDRVHLTADQSFYHNGSLRRIRHFIRIGKVHPTADRAFHHNGGVHLRFKLLQFLPSTQRQLSPWRSKCYSRSNRSSFSSSKSRCHPDWPLGLHSNPFEDYLEGNTGDCYKLVTFRRSRLQSTSVRNHGRRVLRQIVLSQANVPSSLKHDGHAPGLPIRIRENVGTTKVPPKIENEPPKKLKDSAQILADQPQQYILTVQAHITERTFLTIPAVVCLNGIDGIFNDPDQVFTSIELKAGNSSVGS